MKEWMMGRAGVLLMVLALFLGACNAGAEPTLSPGDAATRLAEIPTAAVLNPTGVTPSQVPSPTPASAPTEPAPLAPPTPLPIADNFAQYTVQAGDTLSTIAFRFNISMAAIQIANDLGESQVVRIGQTLKVPQGKSFPDENVLWVVIAVKPGETLGEICQRFGVRLDDAVRVNKLRDASDIRAGQELIMPVNAPAAFVEPETVAQVVPAEAVAPPPPTLTPSAPSSETAVVEIIPIVPIETQTPVEMQAQIEAIVPIATLTVIPEVLPEPVLAQVQPEQINAAMAMPSGNDPADLEAMRARILALHNQARAAEGIPPLAQSWALQQAAQLHAEDCMQRGYGSHAGSDGASTQTRVSRAGFTGRIWGENWAWGRSVERAFEMWFTEEYPDGPHRRNILSARYAEVGFGIVRSNGGFYFIADFGAP